MKTSSRRGTGSRRARTALMWVTGTVQSGSTGTRRPLRRASWMSQVSRSEMPSPARHQACRMSPLSLPSAPFITTVRSRRPCRRVQVFCASSGPAGSRA